MIASGLLLVLWTPRIRCFLNRRCVMARRIFTREFKVEAVRLIRERGVGVAQAARDLDLHENMLGRWAKELSFDPVQAFPAMARESLNNSRSTGCAKRTLNCGRSATS
jgi:transposase